MNQKIILGIETSCDDTSISILKGQIGEYEEKPEVLAFNFFSQETILKKWGGVVPEIAARNHMTKLTPLLQETFDHAQITPREIDLIGVTTHPGLLGPLLTGLNSAKTLSLLFKTPILPVNHLYAHLEAIHMTEDISYPYLGLLVSGGHSLYIIVKSTTNFEIIGATVDDAAGEAFDKGGKLMGLGYPAGRIIDQLAQKGDKKHHKFPIGLQNSKNANLSFSGVKTSLRQFLKDHPDYLCENKRYSQKIYDLCASYQEAIVSALSLKLKFARQISGELPIVVGGGVACNSALRTSLKDQFKNVFFVKPSFCTDNGVMIANYALRTYQNAVNFPQCLYLDAKGRFIKKDKRI